MAELNVQEITAEGVTPDRWIAVVHGIYGQGRNWGMVGRSLVKERPEWGALLVDLRQHGGSTDFTAPHTIEAAAADLHDLPASGRVEAVLGHSFGGKVALLYGRDAPDVEQVWVIDSTPDAREPSGSAWSMLDILKELPEEFEEREEAVSAMTERGVSRSIAQWMTTNLEWSGERYEWAIDLEDMEALLRDFFRADLWPIVEQPRDGLTLHFVRATESSVLTDDALERLERAETETGRVRVHAVEGGHWLNADNPDALVRLLAVEL